MNIKGILSVCLLLLSCTIYAQDATTNNALINYSFLISSDLIKGLDSYEPITTKEKDITERVAKERQKTFMDAAYELVTAQLEEKSIQLMPIGTMQGAVMYSDYGYPTPLLPKKAVKKKGGQVGADYFFNVNISLSKALVSGLLGVKPEATAKIVVFDKAGNKVKELKGIGKAPKTVRILEFPGKKFDKMDADYIAPFVELMLPTVEQAITEAVKQF